MSQEQEESSLTTAQKCRIERNRAKALNLRQAKLVAHPYYQDGVKGDGDASKAIIKVQGTKYIDSGGGFLLEEAVGGPASASDAEKEKQSKAIVLDDALIIPITYEDCLECGDKFAESFLFSNFGHVVCDKCRRADERHSLITRTEAKAEYLLKDCDFDRREPVLRYISRKNPHNVRWGEMKLYLHLQVEKRAMEVWGSEEELVRQHEQRDTTREISKVRKYNKQMKQLRMEVRSSLYTTKTKEQHVHEFGDDSYNETEDNYTHTCHICGFSETYEKM